MAFVGFFFFPKPSEKRYAAPRGGTRRISRHQQRRRCWRPVATGGYVYYDIIAKDKKKYIYFAPKPV